MDSSGHAIPRDPDCLSNLLLTQSFEASGAAAAAWRWDPQESSFLFSPGSEEKKLWRKKLLVKKETSFEEKNYF